MRVAGDGAALPGRRVESAGRAGARGGAGRPQHGPLDPRHGAGEPRATRSAAPRCQHAAHGGHTTIKEFEHALKVTY